MSDRYIVDRGIVHGAKSIHDINPATLIEKIVRERIYESLYWKEQCFGLDAATLCDKAVDLQFIGGHYANQRVSPFLCLTFKLIQLQPEEEIILEYLNQLDFKYLRAIAAFYVRLFFPAEHVYSLLEPLLQDYRKLRLRTTSSVKLTYMDEFVDSLLTGTRVCDTTLPRLPKRIALEDMGKLEPYKSPLESDSDSDSDSESGGE
ncbi:Pre-mRNA-splicing factor 38A [Sugiyamaella lignohabitans]|uniref:Pre-mRNA-splicing factor 38 n=1 Tax=Sugiyamaella lignohabitans TaxID=796027 RepID=A0A161HMM8_9ASCO|nr:Pre-mRNA-splicing factor 38A [Sugiyamaella lignohabitans]ANB15077.1 Pre-mRNA-splicing factor 38A [Sugiyamaella lignohabitans]